MTPRETFFKSLLLHGFKLIQLQTLSPEGECTCRKGSACTNPGKHPVCGSRIQQSVLNSYAEVETHLSEGGGIGLVLYYDKKELDCPPLNLIVFDCDDLHGESWLQERGISSPIKVRGKRGVHIYCMAEDDTPLFKSNTKYLHPNIGTPRIDIKTTGYMVLPFSCDKRLEINGTDVTNDTQAISSAFSELDNLTELLPRVDPRSVCPPIATRLIKKKTANPKLSTSRKKPNQVSSCYKGLHYQERMKLATRYLKKSAPPSIQGQNPHAALYKVLGNLMHRYTISPSDSWKLIKLHYNPRCRNKNGTCYPWTKSDVAIKIKDLKSRESYSSIEAASLSNPKWKSPDTTRTLERQRNKGLKANLRRGQRRSEQRDLVAALWAIYKDTAAVDIDSRTKFEDLYNDFNTWSTRTSHVAIPIGVFKLIIHLEGYTIEGGWLLPPDTKVTPSPQLLRTIQAATITHTTQPILPTL